MAYYNRNYEKLSLGDMDFLNKGECARVFYNGDIIFKEYYPGAILNCRLTPKMFELLKTVNNPHFIELIDFYSDFTFSELLKSRILRLPFIIDAYTAKYYPEDSVSAMHKPKDYLLDNFRELEILFEMFSRNLICTDDIRRENAVLGEDSIVIIDPDLFYTMTRPWEDIMVLNKRELLNLFKSICIDAVANDPRYREYRAFIEAELANIEVTQCTDVTSELSRKLKYVKKPIELLKK